MKNEYLSIREFADAVGKTQQAIYQQVETRLKSYVKVIDKRKLIHKSAIYEVFGVEYEETISSDFSSDLSSIQVTLQAKNELINSLKKTILSLEQQLEKKDAQIDKLQTLIDQEQQLHKQTKDNYQLLLNDSQEQEPLSDRKQKRKLLWFRKNK